MYPGQMKKMVSNAARALFVILLSVLIFLGYGIVIVFGLPWPGPPSSGSVAVATGWLVMLVAPMLTIITLILLIPYAHRNIEYGRKLTASFKTSMIVGVVLGFMTGLLLLGPSLWLGHYSMWGGALSLLLVTIALGSSFVGLLRFLPWCHRAKPTPPTTNTTP